MMMAAIQPTPASPIALLLAKAHHALFHVAPKKWLTIDLYQRGGTEAVCVCPGGWAAVRLMRM
jgi:hypothetical protein